MSRVPPTSIRRQVFISYRHSTDEDRTELLSSLRQLLVEHFDVRVDLDLAPSDDWDAQIRSWMRTCDVGVMLLSEDLDVSEYCAMEGQGLLDRWRAHDIEAVVPVHLAPLTPDVVDNDPKWAPLKLRGVGDVQALPPAPPDDDRPLPERLVQHLRDELATSDDLPGRRAHLLRPTIEEAGTTAQDELRVTLRLEPRASARVIARELCALSLRDSTTDDERLRAAVRPLALAVGDEGRDTVRAMARMQWVDEDRAFQVLDQMEVRPRPPDPPTVPLSGRRLDAVRAECLVGAASLLTNPRRHRFATYVEVLPVPQHGPLGTDVPSQLEAEVRVAIVNAIHRTEAARARHEAAELARARGGAAEIDLDDRLARRAFDGEPIVAHILSPEGYAVQHLEEVQARLPGVTLLASAEEPISGLADCGLTDDELAWLPRALTWLDYAIDEAE